MRHPEDNLGGVQGFQGGSKYDPQGGPITNLNGVISYNSYKWPYYWVPSKELTYPPKIGFFFLFPRWDMLVPWRVTVVLTLIIGVRTPFTTGDGSYHRAKLQPCRWLICSAVFFPFPLQASGCLARFWGQKGQKLPSLKLTARTWIETPWKRRFLLETIIFRGCVGFREGSNSCLLHDYYSPLATKITWIISSI